MGKMGISTRFEKKHVYLPFNTAVRSIALNDPLDGVVGSLCWVSLCYPTYYLLRFDLARLDLPGSASR